MNNIAAIILAAGKGTRMKSSLPKVMHHLANEPIISHVLRACNFIPSDHQIVVIGEGMDDLAQVVSPAKTVVQTSQNGTGDAAKTAHPILKNFDGFVFIILGDGPLIQSETLQSLHEKARETGIAVLGFEAKNPKGYGRLVRDEGGSLSAIIEDKDCSDDQRQINLCNAGTFCVDGKRLFDWLDRIENNNSQGEYYLTDIVEIAKNDGVICGYVIADEEEVMGLNSRRQLADVEKIMQNRLRDQAMDSGVTLMDPDTVYLSADTIIANDVVIEPNVFIGRGVTIGAGSRIKSFSYLERCSIGENSEIGPFARVRPKSKIGNNVSIGNFIEVNRSEVQDGAKSKHISYLGDTTIGPNTNVGAGTIIANYDGFLKNKTHIGSDVFIGSNTTLIAPLSIKDGAIIAAGSVITDNVGDNDLAIARAKQNNIEGWAEEYRARKKEEKAS
jgi:bifunctional UDP-N-acetylglucosamine pyrophosphorylase/glucosamine-1-phosphate N-acetyltransferase